MFTDLDVDDRWVLGQNNVYGLETLIVNIYAPIMNDLDFSYIFEVLTSLRLKDLGSWYVHSWQSFISKSFVGELDLSDIWRLSIPRSRAILGFCHFLVRQICLLEIPHVQLLMDLTFHIEKGTERLKELKEKDWCLMIYSIEWNRLI